MNLPHVLKSGREGDWVYYLRGHKQFRRRYVVPTDRRTAAQLRVRAALSAASKFWSHNPEITDAQRDAWERAANQLQSRPRAEQSGPLTGQQYFVGRACALAHQIHRTVAQVSQPAVSRVSQPAGRWGAPPTGKSALRQTRRSALPGGRAQRLTGTTWELRYTCTGATCGRRRERSRSARPAAGGAGQRGLGIRSRPDARPVRPACGSGAGIAQFPCGWRPRLAPNRSRTGRRTSNAGGQPPPGHLKKTNIEP